MIAFAEEVVGLRSPVVNNRNTATTAVEHLPVERWTGGRVGWLREQSREHECVSCGSLESKDGERIRGKGVVHPTVLDRVPPVTLLRCDPSRVVGGVHVLQLSGQFQYLRRWPTGNEPVEED